MQSGCFEKTTHATKGADWRSLWCFGAGHKILVQPSSRPSVFWLRMQPRLAEVWFFYTCFGSGGLGLCSGGRFLADRQCGVFAVKVLLSGNGGGATKRAHPQTPRLDGRWLCVAGRSAGVWSNEWHLLEILAWII